MKRRISLGDRARKARGAALTLGAAGLGAAVASALNSQGTSEAHPATGWGHLGEYTYSEPDCSDGGVDPITVIFTGEDVSADWITEHANMATHGYWWNNIGSDQYFLDHADCQPFDGQAATGDSVSDRFHMRYNVADIGGEPEAVSPYLFHAPASPHDEEFVWPGCGIDNPNHAVRSYLEEPPYGGFVTARERLVDDWTDASGHLHVEYETQDWGNVRMFEQCDGGLAWSDGDVYIIHTEESGGGLPPVSGRGWYSVPY